jgi:hypothetical protein
VLHLASAEALPTGVRIRRSCAGALTFLTPQAERTEDDCVGPAPEVSEIAPWIAACQPRLAHRMSNGWTVVDNGRQMPTLCSSSGRGYPYMSTTPPPRSTVRGEYITVAEAMAIACCQITWSSDLPKLGSPCEAANTSPTATACSVASSTSLTPAA